MDSVGDDTEGSVATKREEIESGCLSRCADDEPVFVLRAKDKLAPFVVLDWLERAQEQGVSSDKILEAKELADQMFRWQQEHGCRVPD